MSLRSGIRKPVLICLFLLLYAPSQQLWSLRDGQFTFSWASLNKQLTSPLLVTDNKPFLSDSEGRRMTVEIITLSISTKVWDRAGIELATPGSAVRLASVARHVTDCATWPGEKKSRQNDQCHCCFGREKKAPKITVELHWLEL